MRAYGSTTCKNVLQGYLDREQELVSLYRRHRYVLVHCDLRDALTQLAERHHERSRAYRFLLADAGAAAPAAESEPPSSEQSPATALTCLLLAERAFADRLDGDLQRGYQTQVADLDLAGLVDRQRQNCRQLSELLHCVTPSRRRLHGPAAGAASRCEDMRAVG